MQKGWPFFRISHSMRIEIRYTQVDQVVAKRLEAMLDRIRRLNQSSLMD